MRTGRWRGTEEDGEYEWEDGRKLAVKWVAKDSWWSFRKDWDRGSKSEGSGGDWIRYATAMKSLSPEALHFVANVEVHQPAAEGLGVFVLNSGSIEAQDLQSVESVAGLMRRLVLDLLHLQCRPKQEDSASNGNSPRS